MGKVWPNLNMLAGTEYLLGVPQLFSHLRFCNFSASRSPLKTNIFLNKKSSLEYVIKSLYGSVRVPSVFSIELKGDVGF